ncbi:hypothetical protein ElyMa_005237500 [Elysia marginata]|uniref:PH domain-containing protein n=1 Tax=Elysia marginata TaxID=1093978 RepID=A0AAV4JWM3_9GAST|nr:hypothetical protein ElyMa_005237500 [Elysia marginata]
MICSEIEFATSRSRVRRANHSAMLLPNTEDDASSAWIDSLKRWNTAGVDGAGPDQTYDSTSSGFHVGIVIRPLQVKPHR